MRRLIYLINWRASKLQMDPRQAAHWYPFDHAQGSNTGTAKWHAEASATPCLASACGNPKGYHRNSHNYFPPWRKFLTTETLLRLLLLGNPVGLDIRLKCVLIAKIRHGGSTLRPLQDTPATELETPSVVAGSCLSISNVGFSRHQSTMDGLDLLTQLLLVRTVTCWVSISSAVTHGIRDECVMCRGV